MKIVVLGGGNIGSILIGDLGLNKTNQVYLYTNNIDCWDSSVAVYDKRDNFLYKGVLCKASNNKEEIFLNADLIISTLPSHVFPSVFKEIHEYIPANSIFSMMPGSGGGEYYCKSLIEKNCTILGFQRVHCISRIKEKGKSVYSLGKKDKLYISTLSNKNRGEITNIVQKLFGIETIYIDNYLNITLTPSNPILHTTRLYSLFPKPSDYVSDREPLFYEEWTNDSSRILFECDNELQNIKKEIIKFGLDLSAVVSLSKYYESPSIEAFTKKISSIEAFKGITAPMKKRGNKYIPNLDSRYFQEDFLYGLAIIKSCAILFDVETPSINAVLKWYENIFNLNLFSDKGFCYSNVHNLQLPHLIFNNKKEFIKFYQS